MTSFYPILYLTCAGLVFISGSMVLRHNPRNPVNRKYALSCVTIFVWMFGYGITIALGENLPSERTLTLFKISFSSIIFIPPTLWSFIREFYDIKKSLLPAYILFSLITLILWISPDGIISGVHHYPWAVYPKAGPFHPLFLLFFITGVSWPMAEAIRATTRLHLPTLKLNQSKCVIGSYLILAIGCIDFIPNYGINIYPVGCIASSLFILIIGYGVLKYQLMDINLALKRGTVYSLMVSIMTLVYLLVVITVERFLSDYFGYKTLIGSLAASILLALIFIPLRNTIQAWVDKIFLGKAPTQIAEENEQLQNELCKREKFRMAATFTGSVAHEIKNPLTAISTFIEQFPNKKDDPEFIAKFHALASKELSRVQHLSRQLTDFAKPSQMNLATFDLHTPLNETLALIHNRLQKHNISTRITLNPRETLITGDENQIKQVFLNLILNAIDAMPDGGTISVETSVSDEMIHVRISDTGHGISDENLKNLFQPFFTTKKDGTGLGLSICKRIIESHEGKIEAFSQPGQGTTFVVSLPTNKLEPNV